MRKKKPQNRNSFVKAKLRQASLQWKPRNEALKLARKERGLYECAMCHGLFKNGQFQQDHEKPVVPIDSNWEPGYIDWNVYIPNLLAYVEGWQCLCLSCHSIKTELENKMRVKYSEIKNKGKIKADKAYKDIQKTQELNKKLKKILTK